jgi:hypothetical protein
MYKKKTLRHMQPITRRYARVINDLDGVLRRLRNLTEEVARLELDATALHNRNKHDAARSRSNGAELEKRIDAAVIFYDPALKDVDPQTGEDELTAAVDQILPGKIHWEKAGEVHAIHTPIDKATEILFGPAPEDLLRQQQEAADEL